MECIYKLLDDTLIISFLTVEGAKLSKPGMGNIHSYFKYIDTDWAVDLQHIKFPNDPDN